MRTKPRADVWQDEFGSLHVNLFGLYDVQSKINPVFSGWPQVMEFLGGFDGDIHVHEHIVRIGRLGW
jgi:hypothetical protein